MTRLESPDRLELALFTHPSPDFERSGGRDHGRTAPQTPAGVMP